MTIIVYLIFILLAYYIGIFLGSKAERADILRLIKSRISEIIGDAQPRPALRAELEELINRIKDGN